MPDTELVDAARWRISEEDSKSVDSIQCDCFDVGPVTEAGKPRREVIAVYATIEDIESHVALLTAEGLVPIAIDAAAGAIARCMSGGSTSLIVDVGAEVSMIIAIRSGLPFFVRSVPRGWNHSTSRSHDDPPAAERGLRARHTGSQFSSSSVRQEAISRSDQTVGLLARDLSHEITLSLHYLSDNDLITAPVGNGCVVGADLLEDALITALNDASSIDFRPLGTLLPDPIQSLLSHRPAGERLDAWLLPLGLAMYGHEHKFQRAAA